ncbi:helix-turn-helix domain-containing protein [Fluviicola sp.]|uniref:helix-turn-helix domain-containing protein n=1 Tax=Fluviicola sp. TaxID=1917219 RepID=UPI0031D7DBA5
MKNKFVDIGSITEVHRFYKYGKPKHPLISVIDLTQTQVDRPDEEVSYRTSFYILMCKKITGTLKYGRSYYDFEEGSLMFTAPGQVITSGPEMEIEEGWGLFVHPDLLAGTDLGRKIREYSFFHYEANEALHVSEDEKQILLDCLGKIVREYSQNTDKHTKELIVDNLQLLLNYCNRFYDRQFFTREKVNNDLVQRFEKLLIAYFSQETLIDKGLPDVGYFASKLSLSSNYLSDLLSKHTGKSTQEHIHLQLIERAKNMLWGNAKTIAEIAYELGFEYPSHFTKLFKSKTGMSPSAWQKSN